MFLRIICYFPELYRQFFLFSILIQFNVLDHIQSSYCMFPRKRGSQFSEYWKKYILYRHAVYELPVCNLQGTSLSYIIYRLRWYALFSLGVVLWINLKSLISPKITCHILAIKLAISKTILKMYDDDDDDDLLRNSQLI